MLCVADTHSTFFLKPGKGILGEAQVDVMVSVRHHEVGVRLPNEALKWLSKCLWQLHGIGADLKQLCGDHFEGRLTAFLLAHGLFKFE